ncbi:MAG: anti-sigma factor family protein [Myxococcota bacterium]
MNCREFVDFLMDYLEGELPKGQRETFDSHMEACPSCVLYLDTYQKTIRLGRSLCDDPDGPPPPDAPERLVAAILAARARSD